MNGTTEKLAEALRAVLQFEQRITASPHDGGAAIVKRAREALAQYDGRPRGPDTYGGTLAHVIAQCVHFAWDDFSPEGEMPADVRWTVAYQVACFLAQHTLHGCDGVDTEAGLSRLRVSERIPYPERVQCAEDAIASLGGALTWLS